MFIPTIGAHPAYHGSGDPENAGPCFKEGDPGFFSTTPRNSTTRSETF